MSHLHLTATFVAGLILGVFGLANYLLDGRPFHTPIAIGCWADDRDKMENSYNAGTPKCRAIGGMSIRNKGQRAAHLQP
ncbi:hypothetical protein N9452_09610 [Alphaproteobacteria bacterium]|nr:hypothetical protein [Alphaproteobacteria bacterium]